ncbi:glucose-6-phosphate isomerase, partial [Microcystis wesenbergii FACHB-1339]|nr:glucose-6-phosphate isomerase [Microcystis wesenbergii FACHB-1339]
LVNINAYHQPGVEAGKKAAASILDLQRKIVQVVRETGTALDLTTLAAKIGSSDQVEAIYKIVRHLHANQRSLTITGDLSKPETIQISTR